jgi:RNA polymerase sigma factor (sigma-70 family)
MAALQRGGWLALFRTLAPAPPDSDADLLARFVQTRDEAALDALIRRYAGLVMGVCRRRLGDTPDADDAFQATFLVLAQKAGSVSRGASLPAWLHRVASLTSLKLAGRLHRRGTAPMDADVPDPRPDSPDAAGERNEVSAALDDEIAALAEKFRGPVVLCYLEGRTNAEAATTLGIPVGTVDSRLHSAKATLRTRLTRRGFAGAALATGLPAGVGASDELIRSTVRAALAYSAGSSLAAPAVTTLAREVTSAMTTFKFKLLAAAAMVATLAGGLGTGVYFAQAGGAPQAKAKPDAKAIDTKPAAAAEPGATIRVETTVKAPGTTAATTAILGKDAGFNGPLTVPIGELFEQLSKEHGATFRIENVHGLKVMGIDNPYERTVELRFTKGLSVQDILDEVLNALTPNEKTLGFRVKGNQVLLGKVFVPPTSPSAFARGEDQAPHAVPPDEVNKLLYGPTVSLAAKDQTLAEIIDTLREQTGANIVLNGLAEVELDRKVTVTLNDTKLFTVLKVVGDMYGLAPATVDNVFYVTTPEKAEKMNGETARALFGEATANPLAHPGEGRAKPAAKAGPKKPE